MSVRYEELRAAVAGDTGAGWQLGWGVLAAKGMAAWAAAWRALPEPKVPPVIERPSAGLSDGSDELVRVLAAMALAHLRPAAAPPGPARHEQRVDGTHGHDSSGRQGDPRTPAA